MCKNKIRFQAAITALLVFSFTLSSSARQKQGSVSADGREVTILVTAHPHSDRKRAEAMKLRAEDFAVREEKLPQKIISVKPASEAPPIIAVLLQDDLQSRVNRSEER